MKRKNVILGLAVVVGALLAVGTADYGDAQLAQARYEAKVCGGIHPDYKMQGVVCE